MPHEFLDHGGSTRLDVTALLASDAPPPMPDDAYPAVFKDQRTMLRGGLECETAADVWEKVWRPHLARYLNREPVYDDQKRAVTPYLNQGRWVADCPECANGMACWDRNPHACCLGCGRVFEVSWQPPQERSQVMRYLAGLPEHRRNWDAHKGETYDELVLDVIRNTGVAAELRNGLLVAANVCMPDELNDISEYLERLRKARRANGVHNS